MILWTASDSYRSEPCIEGNEKDTDHTKEIASILNLSAKTIDIVAVGPRKTIYEETYRIIKKEDQK